MTQARLDSQEGHSSRHFFQAPIAVTLRGGLVSDRVTKSRTREKGCRGCIRRATLFVIQAFFAAVAAVEQRKITIILEYT